MPIKSKLIQEEQQMQRKKFIDENPHLTMEWDCEKNNGLNPEDFTCTSRRFVWWICAWGHSWQDRISNRVKGLGCPYDSGKRIRHSFTTLAVVRPDLSAEWDYEKNDFLSPEDVDISTSINAWWHCENGHSWKAKVADRLQGSICPICYANNNSLN